MNALLQIAPDEASRSASNERNLNPDKIGAEVRNSYLLLNVTQVAS